MFIHRNPLRKVRKNYKSLNFLSNYIIQNFFFLKRFVPISPFIQCECPVAVFCFLRIVEVRIKYMISQARRGLRPKLGRRYFFGMGKKFPNAELINPMALKQNKPKNGIQRLELTYSQRRNALNQTLVHTLVTFFPLFSSS